MDRRDLLERAARWMAERGWRSKLAKCRQYEQSLLEHSHLLSNPEREGREAGDGGLVFAQAVMAGGRQDWEQLNLPSHRYLRHLHASQQWTLKVPAVRVRRG